MRLLVSASRCRRRLNSNVRPRNPPSAASRAFRIQISFTTGCARVRSHSRPHARECSLGTATSRIWHHRRILGQRHTVRRTARLCLRGQRRDGGLLLWLVDDRRGHSLGASTCLRGAGNRSRTAQSCRRTSPISRPRQAFPRLFTRSRSPFIWVLPLPRLAKHRYSRPPRRRGS